jgi:NAD(P)-dependent dehydrogenase (short-subunit alcohol dehydrogenase family)
MPVSADANPLALPAANAVIAGTGAIGTSMAEALLARPQTRQLFILHRGQPPDWADPRVSCIGFDALQPDTIANAARTVGEHCDRIHLLMNTVGMLHDPSQEPEKRLADLEPDQLLHSMALNAVLLPLLAQSFSPLLRHRQPALLASLSARVGSLEDNKLGGWYSYRASKAAHNMLLLSLAREWRVSHRNVILLALHPGTVRSRLSEPFISASYPNRVLEPQESAAALLQVMTGCRPADSGSFLDWRGNRVPW